MKLSKIIFISLLSIIALIILSSALYIRLTGQHKDDLTGMNILNQKLPEIRVICISNCNRITVSSSDTLSIKATWPKDSIFHNDFFSVKDDTLTLSDFKQYTKIEIVVNKKISDINLKKSDITISSISPSRIAINMEKSNLYFRFDSIKKPSLIKITAKNHSQINSNSVLIDSVYIELSKSHSNFGLYAKYLDIALADSSSLFIKQPMKLIMKRDSSCSFYSY